MLTFVTIVHVVLCVFMIFVILLQPGKDAGMGAALGGGAATSAFGGRGAVTFLSKLTGICAALFFLTAGIVQSIRATDWRESEIVSAVRELLNADRVARNAHGGNGRIDVALLEGDSAFQTSHFPAAE